VKSCISLTAGGRVSASGGTSVDNDSEVTPPSRLRVMHAAEEDTLAESYITCILGNGWRRIAILRL
jgi:hypothetical protein